VERQRNPRPCQSFCSAKLLIDAVILSAVPYQFQVNALIFIHLSQCFFQYHQSLFVFRIS